MPDIKPYLAGASVFIMPFRVGSGTRLKLIEALAAGKAVVSTRVGVEGFPVADGEHLLLADTAVEFADRTTALLLDPQQRENLGRQGRLFAKNYDWRVVVPKFEAVYEHLAHLRGNVQ